jgi:hypothetical protein
LWHVMLSPLAHLHWHAGGSVAPAARETLLSQRRFDCGAEEHCPSAQREAPSHRPGVLRESDMILDYVRAVTQVELPIAFSPVLPYNQHVITSLRHNM